ncbi:MAG: hypothetical protein U9O98_04955 [Asgard group archaeon]|nr:hypothetical protein [Asgard group archaeon]
MIEIRKGFLLLLLFSLVCVLPLPSLTMGKMEPTDWSAYQPISNTNANSVNSMILMDSF